MPLSAEQVDAITRTVLGEARPNDPEGQAAVAWVIRNRSESRGFPNDPAAVAQQGNARGIHQFSAWNTRANEGNDLVNTPATSPRYQAVENVVRNVFNGTTPDPTNGATYYHTPAVSPSWDRNMTETARLGGHIFYSPHPVPPANIPGPLPAQPSADLQRAREGSVPGGYNVVTQAQRNAMAALPFDYPPPPLPQPRPADAPQASAPVPLAPQQVIIGGKNYVVGETYQLSDGATFRANADGTFTKAANAPKPQTAIQLLAQAPAIEGGIANAMNAAQNAGGAVKNTAGSLANSAGAVLGNAFGSLFGSSPATGAEPKGPFDYTPKPDNQFLAPGFADSINGNGGWDALFGQSVRSPTPAGYNQVTDAQRTAMAALPFNSGPIAGTVQLPRDVRPNVTVPPLPGSPARSANNGGWNDLFSPTTTPAGYNTVTDAQRTAMAALPFDYSPPRKDDKPTFIDKQVQVTNPAYTEWLRVPDGLYNYVPPDIKRLMNMTPDEQAAEKARAAAAVRPPAPPKMIAQTVRVAAKPAYSPQTPIQPVAPKPVQPIASSNGYTYLPNGNGGYVQAGKVNPTLTPAQQYAASAAKALASQPNGNSNNDMAARSRSYGAGGGYGSIVG